MMQSNQVPPVKKTRIRRSPEMIAQLVWEAERKNNAAEICRRENIGPSLFYRWRQKFKEAGIGGLQALKRGPKMMDSEKIQLQKEVSRLTQALCETSIELMLLKKNMNST